MDSSNVSIIMNKMKGYAIVKKSKERKMERKAKHKALSVAKTEKSRQRRLDNKAKRDKILAIDPDAKIVVINGVPYIDDIEVKPELKTSEDFDQKLQDRIEEVEAVIGTVDSESKFKKIINKWRL